MSVADQRWQRVGGAILRTGSTTILCLSIDGVGQRVDVDQERLDRNPELLGDLLDTMVRDLDARLTR